MSAIKKYFEKNDYVVLTDALTQQECDFYVNYIFDLHKQGKTEKDDQCPLSDSVYGDPIFEDLLQKFAKQIGDNVGRELLPTYAYARIYRTGEILKRHTDRPSCEISATLTLGYEANTVWPIYFNEEKEISINLEIGELAVYKGCEIVHWRPAFKGKWQVQVFLHYVDANGAYKDHAKDGRDTFGVKKRALDVHEKRKNLYKNINHHGITISHKDDTFPGYYCINHQNKSELMFTAQECEKIISLTNYGYPESASVGGDLVNSKIKRKIRSADIYPINYDKETTHWIYDKILTAVEYANCTYFDYEISMLRYGLQLVHYSVNQEIHGHYDWHIDAGNGKEVSTRKISFTAQLSDPKTYTGCDLIVDNHAQELIATKELGSIHMFPGYMPHKVSPIISGDRYALVVWIHGSRRFR